MAYTKEVKEEAYRLHTEEQLSLSRIRSILGVARSTLSKWFSEAGLEKLPPAAMHYSAETRLKLSLAAIKGNANRKLLPKPINELISFGSVRKRIFNERGRVCEICGWKEPNPFTGIVPVQVDHIDGDRNNNFPSNLQVVCPNCHALTEHFMFYGRSHKGDWGLKGTKRYR